MNDAEVREPRDAEAPEPRVRSFYERTRGRRFMHGAGTVDRVGVASATGPSEVYVVGS